MSIDLANFTPLQSLVGGVLIGSASILMLTLFGRIAGVSGILGGVLSAPPHDRMWRIVFIGGIICAGMLATPAIDLTRLHTHPYDASIFTAIIAGLLVGFGTRLGSGCTSGHGICGISRLSIRSIVATVIFIFSGIITVTLMRILS